ncbi:MAG: hypothetical protein IPN38_04080 [Flavobacteriales bacterium]|nr:hypothetical protein [Flavobacteriales bacterium]
MDKARVNLNVTQLNMQLDLSDEQEAKVKEPDTRYIKRHEALSRPCRSERQGHVRRDRRLDGGA